MFKTIRDAFKVKEIRNGLIFTFLMLIVVRLGSLIPTPGVDTSKLSNYFANNLGDGANSLLDSFTGGSFQRMSIFALSVTPYITSSIIIQLLTIAIPALEEMQKDGNEGRKKMTAITRMVSVALAIIEALGLSIGFGRSGLLYEYNFLSVAVIVICLTAGSTFVMWLGERITERGVGNGVSIILLINIVSRMPNDFVNLFNMFVKGKAVVNMIFASIIIIGVVVLTTILTVLLNDAERRIPVSYAQKVQGRRQVGGNTSHIPLKVNTGNVMPIIFASTLMSIPSIITNLFNVNIKNQVVAKIFEGLNTNYWFRPGYPWAYIGLVLYIALVIFFAYFYTSISFNPMEIANNLKKQGGFVPGIRPGKSTQDYLNKILNYIVIIGAIGLIIVAIIPIFFNGRFSADVSFGGTSLIIICGVIIETIKQIESKMIVRNYSGFLNS
ncbi:protein translocase subunit secY/sec61 alpha [Lachnospiraceae bacterium NE2001]|nr:protein translocase subunit secY/sec61 alpha [Lachnospiraceae bacterium NE2001]